MSTNWSANTRDISSPRGSALLLMPRKILIKEVVLVEVAFKAAGQHYLSLGMQSGPPEEDQKNTTRLLYTPTQQRIPTYQFATIINFTRFTCCSTSEFQITSSTPPRLFFFCWFLILWNPTIGLCVHYSIWKLEGTLYSRISENLSDTFWHSLRHSLLKIPQNGSYLTSRKKYFFILLRSIWVSITALASLGMQRPTLGG